MKKYKDLEVGDEVVIPKDRCEYLYSNVVKITGFNPRHDIVHYTAPCIFGGRVQSGEYYDRVNVKKRA